MDRTSTWIAIGLGVLLVAVLGLAAFGLIPHPFAPKATETALTSEPGATATVTGCQLPTQTFPGYRFSPITCSWEVDPAYAAATSTLPPLPIPSVTPMPGFTQAAGPCPTTADAKVATGVDVQRLATEMCAFVWRAVNQATTTAICPSGWVCTWDVVNDIVVVHLGVNQTATIRAGTWRYIAAYPVNDAVHDVCALYAKEKAFGLSEVPSFQVRFQPVTDGTLGPVGPQSCP